MDSPSHLNKLDLGSFKRRGSNIVDQLEAQEQERDSLWAKLKEAREAGKRLRAEEARAEALGDAGAATPKPADPDLLSAPTSAELMAMLSPAALPPPGAPLPPTPEAEAVDAPATPAAAATPARSRFGSRHRGAAGARACPPAAPSPQHPAVIASGFICPTCWMRAPSAEVLQRHWEDVHQTPLERVVETTGSLGSSARAAYRKIRRSLSVRPPAIDAAAAPGARAAPPLRKSTVRRSSLPPPKAGALAAAPPDDALDAPRWRQSAVV